MSLTSVKTGQNLAHAQRKLEVAVADLKAAQHTAELLAGQLERERRKRRVTDIPVAPRPKKLKGDKVRVYFGDLHGARMKMDAVAALLADLKVLDPDEIILGGDIMECGGFLAAHHVMGYVHEVEESYEEDIDLTVRFLDRLQAICPRASIDYLEGNHEARVEKWIMTQRLRSNKDAEYLRRAHGANYVLNLTERGIRYFRRSETYDGLRVPGWIRRGKMFITHELASGKNAAGKAVVEAGSNVTFFHTHRRSEGIMDTPGHGVAMAWNPGCLCRRQPLWKHSHPSGWNHGYAVQFVARTEKFIMQNILIDEGMSMLTPFLTRGAK